MIKRALGFAALLALVYGAVWLGAAFWLRARVDAFVADLAGKGYAIEHSEPLFVGFPAAVGLKLADLSVMAPSAQGGWHWQGTPVVVRLHIGAPNTPVIDLGGVQRITGLLSAPHEGLSFNVDEGFATLTFGQGQALENIVVKMTGATVAGAASSETLLTVRDSVLDVSVARGHIAWRMNDIDVPQTIPPLGQTIHSVQIAADVVGPAPAGPLREALTTWRDAGGAIEVRAFALDWPPASAAGTATLALDEALQPMGAATIKFQGFFDIVAALQAKGYVHDREVSMAKIVLGMLARPSASGEPELSLPITVQNRKLSAGPVALMDMPEVRWDRDAKAP
ncbi:MAG: DUF2125 domain-containing protein [Proteobacteria bacterium]|nr:DUF2125 domain-containing protein [Pseudomonadota bacterium]